MRNLTLWGLDSVAAPILFTVLGFGIAGCVKVDTKPLADSINNFADELEDGVVTVENFPNKMDALLAQATKDQKEILRALMKQAENTLSSSIQQGGTEARFTIQFLRDQIAFDLRTLAANLTGGERPEPVPKVATPKLTTLVRRDIGTEAALDLVFTGSNLNAKGVEVVARLKDHTQIKLKASLHTPLLLVIPFNDENRHSVNEWESIEVLSPNSRELVGVAVVDPVEPIRPIVKKTQTEEVKPSPVVVWPEYKPRRKNNGDAVYDNEFDGNGPTISVRANFRVNPNDRREVQAQLDVTMYESKEKHERDGDGTSGFYSSGWLTIKTLKAGQQIINFKAAEQSWRFRDTNGHALQNEPVTHPYIESVVIMGDTKTGQDMSTTQSDTSKSHVKVEFKPFPVDVEFEV